MLMHRNHAGFMGRVSTPRLLCATLCSLWLIHSLATPVAADEFPQMGAVGPKSVGGSPVLIALYVEDVDSVVAAAVAAGAQVERPVQDQFYGDRSGTITDPFGHRWTVATHIEDVPEDEMKRRMAAMGEGCQ